jgi:hypothetical protein
MAPKYQGSALTRMITILLLINFFVRRIIERIFNVFK